MLISSSLRRRFEQNQTDCTFTVLALLPNVTENILEALPVEQLTHELQQKKAERLARLGGEGTPSELSSGAPSMRDGGDNNSSSSFQSSSYIHASQATLSESGMGQPRKSKAQLWNELKISSITRSFTLLYTLSLLTLLTRIQLNLLGRLNYVSSVVSLTRPFAPERANSISLEDNDSTRSPSGPSFGNDFETNRRYLAFTWFLLNKGYVKILSEVQAAVTEVFGTISPTQTVSATRLSELILEVRQKLEGSTATERRAKNWLTYLLPPREEEEELLVESGVLTPFGTSPSLSPDQQPILQTPNTKPSLPNTTTNPLRALLDETSDLIESPTFTRIHTLLLNSLFAHLIETKVSEQAFPAPSLPPPSNLQDSSNSSQRITEIPSTVTVIPAFDRHDAEPSAKLATILAVLTRQAHAIGNGNGNGSGDGDGNEYVQVMESEVRELEAFAAVIYSSQVGQQQQQQREGEEQEVGSGGERRVEEEEGNAKEEVGGGVQGLLESAWSRVLGNSSSP